MEAVGCFARGDVEVLSGRVLVSDCWRGYAVGPGAGSGAGCRPSAARCPVLVPGPLVPGCAGRQVDPVVCRIVG